MLSKQTNIRLIVEMEAFEEECVNLITKTILAIE